MPIFTIVEKITERREIEAETAQEARDSWVISGEAGEPQITVDERWVEDENGEDQGVEA